jgi:hypothetical protein
VLMGPQHTGAFWPGLLTRILVRLKSQGNHRFVAGR